MGAFARIGESYTNGNGVLCDEMSPRNAMSNSSIACCTRFSCDFSDGSNQGAELIEAINQRCSVGITGTLFKAMLFKESLLEARSIVLSGRNSLSLATKSKSSRTQLRILFQP